MSTTLEQRMAERGIKRRDFLKFCAFMTATLALPMRYTTQVATALAASTTRLPVVWLEFQSCTGDTESFLHANNPTVSQLLLDVLSVDYNETLMVAAGANAEKSLADSVSRYAGQYVAIVEGAIPTANGGVYCAVGGKSALSIATEVCRKAMATVAAGTCAFSGGWPGAAPNPTGAKGLRDAVTGIPNLINMPGCPVNAANLTALFVHYLTYKTWPPTDTAGRPLFAYGQEIHEICPRRDHYEADRFVRQWGDAGHRAGWCLMRMGCRGPQTHHNCPSVKWNDATNWPVGAGHPCTGCANPNFWDTMTPFYVARDD